MKTPLELLIAHYKKEKRFLEKEIRESLRYEKDYHTAALLQQGLNECEEALRELNAINDPFEEEMRRLTRVLQHYTSAKAQNLAGKNFRFGSTFYVFKEGEKIPPEIEALKKKHLDFCDSQIQRISQQIEDLEDSTSNPRKNQHTEITKQINLLVENKLKSITLFQPNKRLHFIELKRVKSFVQIKLSYSTKRQDAFYIEDWYVNNLIAKGYYQPNSKHTLVRSFPTNHTFLKTLILKELIDLSNLLREGNGENNFLMKVS